MEINITDIKKGLPGISSVAAQQLYEAFEVCMHSSGHPEEVSLKMEGDTSDSIALRWLSRKGTGIDYWLGDKDSILFQKKARLEVSGILHGDETMIKSRHIMKVEQTNKSDDYQLPAFISIIEFSEPKALFTKK